MAMVCGSVGIGEGGRGSAKSTFGNWRSFRGNPKTITRSITTSRKTFSGRDTLTCQCQQGPVLGNVGSAVGFRGRRSFGSFQSFRDGFSWYTKQECPKLNNETCPLSSFCQ